MQQQPTSIRMVPARSAWTQAAHHKGHARLTAIQPLMAAGRHCGLTAACPTALPSLCCASRHSTYLVVQAAAGRVYQEHLHLWPLLLQVARHTGDRPAGAGPAHKRVQPAARLLPDLLSCTPHPHSAAHRARCRRVQWPPRQACNECNSGSTGAAGQIGSWVCLYIRPAVSTMLSSVPCSAATLACRQATAVNAARQMSAFFFARHQLARCPAVRQASIRGCIPARHAPVFRCARKLAGFSNWSANMALGCSAARRRATLTKWSGWVMDTGRRRSTSAPMAWCGQREEWGAGLSVFDCDTCTMDQAGCNLFSQCSLGCVSSRWTGAGQRAPTACQEHPPAASGPSPWRRRRAWQ